MRKGDAILICDPGTNNTKECVLSFAAVFAYVLLSLLLADQFEGLNKQVYKFAFLWIFKEIVITHTTSGMREVKGHRPVKMGSQAAFCVLL